MSDLPPQESVNLGVLAEANSFESVWVTDHMVELSPGSMVDPWTVLAGIGVQTKDILLCSGVTDAQRCHPAKIAQMVATLDALTGGRAGLGIGAGESMNLVPFGIAWENPDTRAERLAEAIEVIKLLWSTKSREKAVDYTGKHYRLRKAWLDQASKKKPHPPVYVGAMGSVRLLRIVGKIGDGWFPWLNTPRTYEKRLGVIRDSAARSGRDFESIDRVAWLYTLVSGEAQEVEMAKGSIRNILVSERNTLRSLGIEIPLPRTLSFQQVLAEYLDEKTKESSEAVARSIPDDVAKEFLAVGTEECVEAIAAFVRAGATHIAVRDMGQDTRLMLQEFDDKIIPYFKEKSS